MNYLNEIVWFGFEYYIYKLFYLIEFWYRFLFVCVFVIIN